MDAERVIKGLECCAGHGRCIDCPYFKTAYDPAICMREYLLRDALELLKAQEPKRGQWMTDGDRLYCSSCEGTQINEVVLNGKQIYFLDIGEQMKYCGKCGARMDGGRE